MKTSAETSETQEQTEARMKANLSPATHLPALLISASHFAPTGKFMARRRLLALSPGSLVLAGAMKKVKAA